MEGLQNGREAVTDMRLSKVRRETSGAFTQKSQLLKCLDSQMLDLPPSENHAFALGTLKLNHGAKRTCKHSTGDHICKKLTTAIHFQNQ